MVRVLVRPCVSALSAGASVLSLSALVEGRRYGCAVSIAELFPERPPPSHYDDR